MKPLVTSSAGMLMLGRSLAEACSDADCGGRTDDAGSVDDLGLQIPEAEVVPRVLILLSTYNGATYLHEQLQSLLAQTHTDWVLYWRDDGSSDTTLAVMAEFTARVGNDRCVRILEPQGRLRPAASFVTMLRAAVPVMCVAECVAFADQDDVWLPDKLSRGVKALAGADATVPTLYCARLVVVDARLRLSLATTISQRECGFPASLTQNIATACTVMLNRSAAALIAASALPDGTFHDWWSYLLVTAAGGQVLVDESVVALYRQHGSNVVGMPSSDMRRAVAALRRGPGAFVTVLRGHVTALVSQPGLLTAANHAILVRIQVALQGGIRQRLRALGLPGLRRRGRLETLLFRVWFLIG
jgi:Glycosyl transferase family 2